VIFFHLPCDSVCLQTRLTADEVVERLSEQVEPRRLFRFHILSLFSRHKPYERVVHRDYLRIQRILGYGNAWLPAIEANIFSSADGCSIDARMRIASAVAKVFSAVWLGFGELMLVFALFQAPFPLLFIASVVVVGAGWVMMQGGFKYEATKAKRFLLELLEAEQVCGDADLRGKHETLPVEVRPVP